jgi:hypothetical protein
MNYTDCPEFNDYLDQEYEEVKIANFSSLASSVLFELDREAYIDAYNAYLSEQKSSFPAKVIEFFPAPIAFYLERTLYGYDNNIQRLHLLRSTWEALIYILYAIAIGEVIDRGLNLSSLRIFSNQKIKLNNGLLSDKLGYKLEVIEKILDYNADNNLNLIIGEIIQSSAIEMIRELNNERNSISHIAALGESQSEEKYHELEPKVTDLLFDIRKLESISLIQYKDTQSSMNNIRFMRFDGHSLKKKNYTSTVGNDFITKNLGNLDEYRLFFEFTGGTQIICLSPFAHGISHNGYPHIVFYKKISGNPNHFIFEVVADDPKEVEIRRDLFDTSIRVLESLL